MTTAALDLLIEAALRAMLVALVVWAGLRLLRVGNVMAQKAVWALVLAAAVAMPLLMRWQGIPAFALLRVPLPGLRPEVQTTPPADPGQVSARLSATNSELSGTHELSSTQLPGEWVESQPAISTGGRFPAPANSLGGSAASTSGASIQTPTGARCFSKRSAAHLPKLCAQLCATSWQSFAGFLYLVVAAALILRVAFGLVAALNLAGAEPLNLSFVEERPGSIFPDFSFGLVPRLPRR